MTRTPIVALAMAAVIAGCGASAPAEQQANRDHPRLALLTSLPLLFNETFALAPPANPAVERIERRFTIVPIALADLASLRGHQRLLMAHPRAQPAAVLVELDSWVRAGGQVVVLADPALKWDSRYAIGDRLRPPPDFADTGLLAHWGVRLGVDEAGHGSLRATQPRCRVTQQGLVARCAVGKGVARIIADADFVMGEGVEADQRLDLLMAQLGGRDSR